jgi:plastocyanin
MFNRFAKFVAIAGLIAVVMAVGLFSPAPRHAHAQEGEITTYIVNAGAAGPNNIEILAFGPAYLQVHQGDRVVWTINGFHNVHFNEQPSPLIIVQDVNGTSMPVLNPEVGFPTVTDGATITEPVGANSGLPGEESDGTFELVIDLPPGIYTYQCDVHPGMTGIIEVVADDVAIPSAGEAALVGAGEFGEQINAAIGASMAMASQANPNSVDGVLNITLGSGGTGRATVNLMTPFSGVIKVGESVTWTNPADSIDPHFVNSLPLTETATQDIVPMPPAAEGQPPILAAGPGFLGETPSGSSIAAGQSFNSPFIMPGESFTLTFTEPGIYVYTCHIHPGMNGVIIVQPA